MISTGQIAGASDYNWSEWQGAPLSDGDKATAAAIAENFKSQADYQAYMDQSEDPLLIKFAVEYALRHRKTAIPTGSGLGKVTLPSTGVDLSKVNLSKIDWASVKKPATWIDTAPKAETPWLLYIGGALLLYMLLKGKKGGAAASAKD